MTRAEPQRTRPLLRRYTVRTVIDIDLPTSRRRSLSFAAWHAWDAARLFPSVSLTEHWLSDAPARRQASSIDRRLAPAGRNGARLAQLIDVAQLGVHRPAAPPATPGYRDASRFARRLRDCEPARCAGRPTGARSHRQPTCPGRTPVQLAESRSCISVARNSARSKLSPCGPIRTMIRKTRVALDSPPLAEPIPALAPAGRDHDHVAGAQVLGNPAPVDEQVVGPLRPGEIARQVSGEVDRERRSPVGRYRRVGSGYRDRARLGVADVGATRQAEPVFGLAPLRPWRRAGRLG